MKYHERGDRFNLLSSALITKQMGNYIFLGNLLLAKGQQVWLANRFLGEKFLNVQTLPLEGSGLTGCPKANASTRRGPGCPRLEPRPPAARDWPGWKSPP